MVKRCGLGLLPLAAGLCAAFPAQAAWDFKPVVVTRATWSDNIALQSDALAESGSVLELTPGFQLVNRSQRFNFALDYSMRLYKYSGRRPNGTQRRSQNLNGALKSSLVEDLLYLDATAAVHQQAVSPFAPLGTGNDYLDTNRNEIRSYRVSPYLVHRFGAFAAGSLRYTRSSVSSDNAGFRRSDEDSLSAQLSSGPSFRRFGWDASVQRTVMEQALPSAAQRGERQTSSIKGVNLGLNYAASQQLKVGVFGGYDDFDFSGPSEVQAGASYGANLEWVPSARTFLSASAGHRFYGPSYNLNLQHRSRGTVWNITYSDAVSSSRSQFTLPQAVDTAAMLDNLFRAQISDPTQRAAAVQAYMQATGLPPALATSLNFLSNRYSLQKQFNASMAWQLARTTSMLTVFHTRREMLSSQQFDSGLLGSSLATLNDNTEQVGLTANVSYRLGAQTTATLTGTASNAKSLSDGVSSQQRLVRLGISRSFGKRVSGVLEARHAKGSRALDSQWYTENAVTATLTSKF